MLLVGYLPVCARMVDFLLHIDKHLGELIARFGPQVYLVLGFIVFCETGLVVTPFLPGDSLIFAIGLFCHPTKPNSLNFGLITTTLVCAALLGDNVNYFIGRTFGHKLFKDEKSKIFKKSHLEKTHHFFEKHGRRTIVLARFVPVVRTFAPFVAGMGQMPYREFLTYSVLGALLWVYSFATAGFFLGQIPWVEKNLTLAIVIVVVATAIPIAIETWKAYKEAKHVGTPGSGEGAPDPEGAEEPTAIVDPTAPQAAASPRD